MRTFFGNLKFRNYVWASVLATIGIWWPSFIILKTPEFLDGNVDFSVLYLCMIVAIIGALIKIIGYSMSVQPGSIGVIGVSVELAGLILASIGPLAYVLSYIVIWFLYPQDSPGMSSSVILAIAVCLIYVYRATILIPRFFREAHDPNKE
jgi:hypothetical protein